MEKELVLDGISYKLGRYDYGTDVEINDRAIALQFNEEKKEVIPVPKAGIMSFLMVYYALRSWTFRGMKDGELITDTTVNILPITEDNLKKIPSQHGNQLIKISSEINGVNDKTAKN